MRLRNVTVLLITILMTTYALSVGATEGECIKDKDKEQDKEKDQNYKNNKDTTTNDITHDTTNDITQENSMPGTPSTVWDINGAGDPSIQGFTTQQSYSNNETVQFKVNTTTTNWHIEIYRMGWYDGLGARLIETVHPSSPTSSPQPPCKSLDSGKTVECSNWSVSASWVSSSPRVSGVYIGRLVRLDPSCLDPSLDPSPLHRTDLADHIVTSHHMKGRKNNYEYQGDENTWDTGAYGMADEGIVGHKGRLVNPCGT